jgi:hypothetical protein
MRYFKIIDAFENDEYSHRIYSCLREDFKWSDDDAELVAGYTVDWVCDEDGVPDYDAEPKWYFWKAGWEDELELEWFDDKDAAYERLVQYKAELEEKAENDTALTLSIEKSQDWEEFRKEFALNSWSETFDMIYRYAEKSANKVELVKNLNKRIMELRNYNTAKILDTLA